mmetsp:Transcript_41531/g.111311  ORF Transcript_41531/g.111311 Transcript_41531/m.111311 type:complete len:211 (-) Transcript_41531:37-669(-)
MSQFLEAEVSAMKEAIKSRPPRPQSEGKTAEPTPGANAANGSASCGAKETDSKNTTDTTDKKIPDMMTAASGMVQNFEEEFKRKEKILRDKMQSEFGKIHSKQRQLEEIRRELEKLEEPMRRDVSLIRTRLETLDRDLLFATKEHARKKKEYEEAAEALDKKRQEKSMLAEHLRMIIHDNEQRKASKLEELMHKLGMEEREGGGAVFDGF